MISTERELKYPAGFTQRSLSKMPFVRGIHRCKPHLDVRHKLSSCVFSHLEVEEEFCLVAKIFHPEPYAFECTLA